MRDVDGIAVRTYNNRRNTNLKQLLRNIQMSIEGTGFVYQSDAQ